ncbi:uncharacterized protein LOC131977794 isoform X4 [Centropristis striata]|uniref:uncharacterized protein LOC131977794 isoform X4 n=1 Tax=Centropristis striata TaxID=184440 RepID=UPI0027DEFF70|nr:uncharacterized protein LOC131977794 isoform X4 [Centropristis striata]
MKTCVAVVLMSLLSLGLSAPLSGCDSLVKPITVSSEDMLGKWLYIGGSSDLPGSRSLGHLMTSVWLDITATSQSNILNIIQTQRIFSKCSSLIYNVTFENSTMLIEQPFYLKEVYLTTDCSDCLVAHEKIVSGKDTFTSLLLFSRRQSVSSAAVETLKKQAECLQMPSPIMINTDYEICPDNIPPSEGISALNSLSEAKTGHRVAKLLDAFFDMFVN